MKNVAGFPGYLVSHNGDIWSDKGKSLRKLKPFLSGKYWSVSFRKGDRTYRKYVHHVVLEAFVGPRPSGMEAIHGERGRDCNAASNLKWGTHVENMQDKHRDGTVTCGEDNPASKFKLSKILRVFKWREKKKTQKWIGNKLGMSQQHVCDVLRGKRWKHLQIKG